MADPRRNPSRATSAPLLRGDVEFDPISRRLYATDAGLSQIEPLGVVSPRDAEDVAVWSPTQPSAGSRWCRGGWARG